MDFPNNITRSHLLKAIAKINKEGIPLNGKSQLYDVVFEGKKYPPKLVVSYANLFANGSILDRNSFDGGKGTPCFNLLDKYGFQIAEKQGEEEISFFLIVQKFLAQATTTDHRLSGYPKSYSGLKIRVGFGQGTEAKIPWIALLSDLDTVQDGIYPGILYFKSEKLLILSYGVSETIKSKRKWNIAEAKTISQYYKEKDLGVPYRYGSSYVHKAYDLTKELDEEEFNFAVDQLISLYKSINSKDTTNFNISDKIGDIIATSHQYIRSLGYLYEYEEIANFYLCLKTKPFVILAGISGTGKTQLPRLLANSLNFGDEQVIQIPVRPDWTDSSDVLGYVALDGNFIPKDLTIAIQRANKNPEIPFFFILDEMNLARVEHYFSDFLSIIETRQRKNDDIITDSILRDTVIETAKNKNDFTALGWPQNLYLIGTVNMDETTHPFSRKVLDRANSIEMNEVDLNWITEGLKIVEKSKNITNDFFKASYLGAIDLNDEEKKSIEVEMSTIISVNKILQQADLHFAYRVRNEIAFYLLINKKASLINPVVALDFQLVQKVLPRIHGSSERVQNVLIELFNLLENASFQTSGFEYSKLEIFLEDNKLKYKRASKKIAFMLKRFDDDRFTSFWL